MHILNSLHIFKRAIKRVLQHIAARFGQHTKNSKQPRLLVLMYHRILPADDARAQLEEPGMMVTPESFDMHLGILKQHFQMVKLDDWIRMKQEGATLPARACAITFDDGWVDNYQYAFPILKQHKVPASIFLVADMIGEANTFWPERLATVLTEIATHQPGNWSHPSVEWLKQFEVDYQFTAAAPTQEQISEIISHTKIMSDDDIHSRIDNICRELDIDITTAEPDLLDWQQVKEMRDSGLIGFGSHTCNHIRLTADTTDEKLEQEIVSSKQTIADRTGDEINSFCFPNGDFSDAALAKVRQHYSLAVSTLSGWNDTDSDIHLLRRIGIHDDIARDETAFLASISGWF